MDLLEPLLTAKQANQADQHTIDLLSLSGKQLMERAGQAIALEVQELLSKQSTNRSNVPVAILCGPGNNGGDGYVAARYLWQNAIPTLLIALAPLDALKNEAKTASHHFLSAMQNGAWTLPHLPKCLFEVTSDHEITELLNQHKPAVIVDAIFGTGLTRPPEDFMKKSIIALNKYKTLNRSAVHVLSIDLPSGMSSDGQLLSDTHVRADSTLAIQFRKVSHLVGPHWLSCGIVKRVDIGIRTLEEPKTWALLEKHQPPLSLLSPPHRTFHKGHYGHVGVFYGSQGVQGASALSCHAALRSGSGLVSLLVKEGEKPSQLLPPEAMRNELSFPLAANSLDRFSAIVIGPGLKEDKLPQATAVLERALSRQIPVIIDAGALGLLGKTCFTAPKESVVIATPHPGEAGRLLGLPASRIEEDRLGATYALLKMSSEWSLNLTWVLKGSCPILAHAKHGIIVCEGGIPTLSVGGSGDVLAGTIAALLSQSETPFQACVLGVSAHLRAGRNLFIQSSRGFLAHEIADEIQHVLFGQAHGNRNSSHGF